MAPEVKQRYQQMAEEGRQKYDQDMAAYRQGNYTPSPDGVRPPTAASAVARPASTGNTSTAAATIVAVAATTNATTAQTVQVTTNSAPTTQSSTSNAPASVSSAAGATAYISGSDYNLLQ